ncbi:MAG TPA: type II toxin-antitoxin system ParD family antitoxin [Vicinamibacterales bacterium]|nr:type II toxin-antitoxin system ParD family antitoxin [Vicinamibacterales bacterium]
MSRATSLTVTLPSDLDAFIRERVAAGRFATPGEAVREALVLLERRERERDAVIDEIRREIQLGIDQAEGGQLRDGETVFRELRHRLGLG